MSGLYANLLGDTASAATISKAPVVFSKPGASTSPPPDSTAAPADASKKINAGSDAHTTFPVAPRFVF